jgi:hypothetical protein
MAIARRVVGELPRYARVEPPSRPDLGVSDGALLALLARHAKGATLTATERATLELFGAWRAVVFQSEVVSASRLLVLLECVLAVEMGGKAARRLRDFVRAEYGRTLPKPLEQIARSLRDYAEWATFRLDLVPRWMRTGSPYDAPDDVRLAAAATRRARGPRQLTREEAYPDEDR